ncbi:MAG: hypothetical protein WC768_01445 [Patescibacteria group bacterium]|jgi:hypothetical protein
MATNCYTIKGGPGRWDLSMAILNPGSTIRMRLWREMPAWEDEVELIITGIRLHDECYPNKRMRFLLTGYSNSAFLSEGTCDRTYFEADYRLNGNLGTLKVVSVDPTR